VHLAVAEARPEGEMAEIVGRRNPLVDGKVRACERARRDEIRRLENRLGLEARLGSGLIRSKREEHEQPDGPQSHGRVPRTGGAPPVRLSLLFTPMTLPPNCFRVHGPMVVWAATERFG